MSDPRRLLSDGATPFEKELLGSWAHEAPSPSARAKAIGLAGVGAALTVASTSAATTKLIAGAGAAASGSLAPKAITLGTLAIVKWLAVGTIAIAAIAGIVSYVTSPPAAVAPLSAAPQMTVAATGVASAVPSPNIVPLAEVAPAVTATVAALPSATIGEEERAASARPPLPPPARAIPSARAPAAGPSELSEQVSSLDRARSALAGGNPAEAQRLVEDHEKKFRGGALGQEAEVLRIQALVSQGDREGAKRAAARFLAAYATSPHASRVRAIVGAGGAGDPPKH